MALLAVVFAFGAKPLDGWEPDVLRQIHDNWYPRYSGWVVMATTVLGAASAKLVSWFGEPWLWDAVHRILNDLRDDGFLDATDLPIDQNKVTLFRYSKSWGIRRDVVGALDAVVRSGHLGSNRRVKWLIGPTSSTTTQAGVAGICWQNKQPMKIENLPDLHVPAPTPSEISQYAQATYVSEEWVRDRLKNQTETRLARAFLAILVEVENRPWGVLMIDSRMDKIPKPQSFIKEFGRLAKVLGVLLKRV